ncbi:MAG: DNA repair protein RecN [Chloroflexi bacterium]|nr:DNA repair protein RecN [Chloroflexota bacterium]
MLIGLHLRDFALADRVELTLGGGFSVITGETGAGKSVLIQALAFALGSPADAEMIRPGADSAEVEAVFDLVDSDAYGPVARMLSDADLPFEGELILRRSVSRPQAGSQRLGGRIRVNDRAATASLLRALAPTLADIHGQREHLSLLRPSEQLALLDRFAGVDHQRDAIGAMVRRLNTLDRRLSDVRTGERERARRIALLRHEASEIAAAGLQPEEEEQLQTLHRRLVNAQTLAADAEIAREALEHDVLGEALAASRRIANVDESAEPIAEAVESALEQAAEAVRSLRVYADELDLDPDRLGEVESRLSLIAEMKRRWGDSIAEVIAHGERAEAEANRLEQETADIDSLVAEAEQLAVNVAAAAIELSQRRRQAAEELAAAVTRECEHLRLPNARFEFEFEQIPASDEARSLKVGDRQVGFDQTGIDRVQLHVAFNPDAPTRPLQRVASGGETARLTLAIKAVLGESDLVPLMVFDEVDVGLGGRSGGMIGERLARLGEHRQVICITHLPQVAARAAQHITVAKSSHTNGTTVDVRMLSKEDRIVELAEMLGGVSDANRASAADLLHPAVAS